MAASSFYLQSTAPIGRTAATKEVYTPGATPTEEPTGPTIGQLWPSSGGGGDGGTGGGGTAIEEVMVQTTEPGVHPDLWVDTDAVSSDVLNEVVIQAAEPPAHPDLWVDTDATSTVLNTARVVNKFSINTRLSQAARTDFINLCTHAPITLTLPTAVGNTSSYRIKNIAPAGTVTIKALRKQYIDGESSYKLTEQYQSVHIVSDNENWIVI